MESIKETELNLQREVVTTVPNTWLVEAVNPSTGDKKMIDIANYASVVAGQFSENNKWNLNSFGERGFDLNNLGANYSVYVENGVNTPNGHSTGHCVSFGYGNVFAIQIYTSNTYAWIRCKYSNVWSEWKKLV